MNGPKQKKWDLTGSFGLQKPKAFPLRGRLGRSRASTSHRQIPIFQFTMGLKIV